MCAGSIPAGGTRKSRAIRSELRRGLPQKLWLTVDAPLHPVRPVLHRAESECPVRGCSLMSRTYAGVRSAVHANPHRFRHTFATWAIENHARELDVQYLLWHSTSAMVRRDSATYDAATAAAAHAAFSPAARLLATEASAAG